MQCRKPTLCAVLGCGLLLMVSGCEGSRPPTGEQLRLRGAKGAQCTYDRECQSNKCRGRQCTEKIDQAGLGGECTSNDYCLSGLHCDRRAKKCAPSVKCSAFSDKLRKCIVEVYVRFRPRQSGKLRRMRKRSRKKFLTDIYRILYRGLCSLTTGGAPYKRALALKKALKQTSCREFSKYYHQGTRKGK